MRSIDHSKQSWAVRFAALPTPVIFFIFFAVVAVSHLTLLRLPYYWDEGGYYIPAALDFYHRFTLIPEFTNAHPPLPSVVLGSLWHVVGFYPLSTRLVVSAFAAAALVAVFRLSAEHLDAEAALTTVLLTALYPIWFAQSTMAHADVFAAAFTLSAFAMYFRLLVRTGDMGYGRHDRWVVALLFSLASLSKETAAIEPATLAAIHAFRALRERNSPELLRSNLRWSAMLSLSLLPLVGWYAFHRIVTGFTFGNPEYLRYNATANFTAGHVLTALRFRFVHLAWQRNMWLPLLLSVVCASVLKRKHRLHSVLPSRMLATFAVLVCANWLAFSVLGGALLTRYLLPIYPIILLVCVAVWRVTTERWVLLAALTAAAFTIALWWSPPAAYAPEDNLTYRDMIVVHQEVIAFIDNHYPNARVLTSWPAAAELYRTDLGYTDHKIMGPEIDNFSSSEIARAEQEQNEFDTALVFSKNFVPPTLAHYLMTHPGTNRSKDYLKNRDLTPSEVALELGGTVVFYAERGGEWAGVIRFPRRYDAGLQPNGVQAASSKVRVSGL